MQEVKAAIVGMGIGKPNARGLGPIVALVVAHWSGLISAAGGSLVRLGVEAQS